MADGKPQSVSDEVPDRKRDTRRASLLGQARAAAQTAFLAIDIALFVMPSLSVVQDNFSGSVAADAYLFFLFSCSVFSSARDSATSVEWGVSMARSSSL